MKSDTNDLEKKERALYDILRGYGSVIVGWDEDPSFGTWWPTVWVNGVRTTLTRTEGFSDAAAVTPDGTIIVGQTWESPGTAWSFGANRARSACSRPSISSTKPPITRRITRRHTKPRPAPRTCN